MRGYAAEPTSSLLGGGDRLLEFRACFSLDEPGDEDTEKIIKKREGKPPRAAEIKNLQESQKTRASKSDVALDSAGRTTFGHANGPDLAGFSEEHCECPRGSSSRSKDLGFRFC